MRGLDDTRPIYLGLTSNFMETGPTSNRRTSADRKAYYEIAAGGCDILSFDVYPIYGYNLEDKLLWVADGVTQLREYAGPRKPVFTAIETCKGSRWVTHERQKEVKPEHTRAEVWMAIIRGATGIVYFTHAWRPSFTEFAPTEEMQAELNRLNDQITRLAPAILAEPGETPVSITLDGGLAGEVITRQYDGGLYLFANNLDMQHRAAVAKISVAGPARRAPQSKCLDEGARDYRRRRAIPRRLRAAGCAFVSNSPIGLRCRTLAGKLVPKRGNLTLNPLVPSSAPRHRSATDRRRPKSAPAARRSADRRWDRSMALRAT